VGVVAAVRPTRNATIATAISSVVNAMYARDPGLDDRSSRFVVVATDPSFVR
jgi:hypothetical protein